ncbi:uncharacterized protein involved in type VI secretion and phage assembly [Janthinobacterium sp. CG_23.3]|uniref:hypothetical protein n=1 Tax=Janthinobacterium sp. CG_23.3 TaxID=3349634 RepID=UPI0038D444E5
MPQSSNSTPLSSSLQALLGAFTQSTRLLQLTTPLGPDKLLVECLRGEEGLSQGYSLKVAK